MEMARPADLTERRLLAAARRARARGPGPRPLACAMQRQLRQLSEDSGRRMQQQPASRPPQPAQALPDGRGHESGRALGSLAA
jgi:hypothetical protein